MGGEYFWEWGGEWGEVWVRVKTCFWGFNIESGNFVFGVGCGRDKIFY